MTPNENYKALVDGIFGVGAVKVKLDNSHNNITGALNDKVNFQKFQTYFKDRLVRLKTKFEKTAEYPKILVQVGEIADDKNWEGAYAELVAYDVLCNDYSGDIQIDVTLPETVSYAQEVGKKKTNEDGYLTDYDAYFDVKIFADTVRIILEGVIKEALKRANAPTNVNIQLEYPNDDDEEYYETNRSQLVSELITELLPKLSSNSKKFSIQSKIIPRLKYVGLIGGGITSTISEYSPLRNAMNLKDMMLKRYTKKIMKSNKFYLVLVNFPWYNNLVRNTFDMNEMFYRCLSRRTFMEYRYQPVQASSVVNNFNGSDTIYEVSNHITGLIFIDDYSIDKGGYAAYIYLNPNAANICTTERSYLQQVANDGIRGLGMFEDFMYDNY